MGTIHATTVAWHGNGVLIRGDPGSGKSDLGLRLIDEGAVLVADDYTDVQAADCVLFASAPDTIRGKMEVRGIGVADFSHTEVSRLALVVTLVPRDAVERVPEPAFAEIEGVRLPEVALCGHDASAPAKVRLAMRLLAEGGRR